MGHGYPFFPSSLHVSICPCAQLDKSTQGGTNPLLFYSFACTKSTLDKFANQQTFHFITTRKTCPLRCAPGQHQQTVGPQHGYHAAAHLVHVRRLRLDPLVGHRDDRPLVLWSFVQADIMSYLKKIPKIEAFCMVKYKQTNKRFFFVVVA